MSEELKHYGMPRRSGRYPWGSGQDSYQRAVTWRSHIKDLQDRGLSDVEISKREGIKTTQLRARMSLTKNEQWNTERNIALGLKDKGYSNVEIGRRMGGRNESSIRGLLDPVLAERMAITNKTAAILKENVDKHRYIDVGTGLENHIGVSRTKLNNAVAQLQEVGYKVHNVKEPQVGMPGKFTVMKVLGTPDTEWKELVRDTSVIKNIMTKSEDYGRTFTTDLGLKPIKHLELDRIKVRYVEEDGGDRDGVIELRRGAKDLDLGNAQYAQVRIGVNGTHFLKGMAIYSDNIPEGVDVVFNTNKHDTGNKLDAMKKLKKDPSTGEIDKDNPFGATIKRDFDEFGKSITVQKGALNVVNEEGDWDKWSKTISSQILSKQTPPVAKTQLNLAFNQKKDEYDEIMALTNPVIKKRLLLAFADDCDSSAVHLKAAGLPRQANKIILPVPELKDTEVYAPSFKNGENVVLIRHPHGGTFEIPQLTVNNNSKAGKAVLGNEPIDAIGINPNVAKKLSGADFDGDTVIVIPNNRGLIRSTASLKALENFDPIEKYRPYDGMKTIDGGVWNAKTNEVDFGGRKPRTQTKQRKMGEVSNLITDMTIKGATLDETARAVKHSMVVIDSEKHHLDYKSSYIENGIASLSERYQNGKKGGASTLISKASSEYRVPERDPRKAQDGGPIDKATGKKVYTKTGAFYEQTKKVIDPTTGKKVSAYTIDPATGKKVYEKTGKIIYKTTLSTKMAEAEDARTLSSGRQIEEIYAGYANNLKSLANTSRKNALSVIPPPRNSSAAKVYSKEVDSLQKKLVIASLNKPFEREAQVYANGVIARKKQANPDMDADEIKKVRNQALAEARVRMGAKKAPVDIEDREWEAIQAGAISPSKLSQILENADLDRVKALATPRTKLSMTPTKIDLARSRLAAGYTLSDVAESLGVSVSTLSNSLS